MSPPKMPVTIAPPPGAMVCYGVAADAHLHTPMKKSRSDERLSGVDLHERGLNLEMRRRGGGVPEMPTVAPMAHRLIIRSFVRRPISVGSVPLSAHCVPTTQKRGKD